MKFDEKSIQDNHSALVPYIRGLVSQFNIRGLERCVFSRQKSN